jgi:predicted dehydrogenase
MLGARIRGKQLLRAFSAFPDVEFAYVCDPDLNLIPEALKQLPARHKRTPKVCQDLRDVFADKDVDAVVVATPDHWHALATIWALQAGKHVYCEKPCSATVVEGRRMTEAARAHKKVVQVGTQRRSGEYLAEAAQYVRDGKLGKVPFARAWIAGGRKSIGKKPDAPVPANVDYDLWTGPAPLRPFNPNRFHYEWHWHWDYGTGELGNNGIHGLDLARWLLGLDAPRRVSSGGGRLLFDDDGQTPDTQTVVYDFKECSLVWEHRIWAKTGLRGLGFGVELLGEKGALVVDDKGWHIEGGEKKEVKASPTEGPHLRDFLDCIKSGKRPRADIEKGHKSAVLCHLGNIAQRLGRSVQFDAAKEAIPGDAEASRMLTRAYRKGFQLPDKV